MKKIISLILALTMIFTLGLTAFAVEEEKPVKVNFKIDGEVVKTIYVDYGEDFNSQAPSIKKEISGGIKYEFSGWDCDNKYYAGTIYETLPVISETTPVYELTFTATYTETKYDGEEIVDDIIGGIIGDDALSGLKTLLDEFIAFLKTVILYLAAFITPAA